jgi:hypothetical protein
MSLKPLVYTLFVLLCLPAVSQAAKLYKWVDDEGQTHYSDKVPPSESRRARTELDKQGVTIDQIDAAKTPEQLRREAEEERLRREQERLAEKQRQADRVLLRTFRTEEDILMTRDGQVQSVDAYIRVTESNIKRLKSTLSEMQQNAAKLELSGQQVSARYKKDIETKRQALKDAYQSIVDREDEKNRIRQSFAQDLQRFRELKQLAQTDNPLLEASQSYTDALLNVYHCGSDHRCETPWKRAKAYLKKHSTTPIRMQGENILMTALPAENNDISITMSRITDRKSGQTLIFMDLQCKATSMGIAMCKRGERIIRIKEGFQPWVAEGTRHPPGPQKAEVTKPAQ